MGTSAKTTTSAVGRDEAVSTAVVEAVSTASETPVFDLPPLYDAVDPDALDRLISGAQTVGVTTFEYAGYLVTIHGDRTIDVSEAP
jgi:hypothetical protein